MTDLEMTKLCAEAMGYKPEDIPDLRCWIDGHLYSPLTDDEQAMALVKKFKLSLSDNGHGYWWVRCGSSEPGVSTDLNRAVVECVVQLIAKRKK